MNLSDAQFKVIFPKADIFIATALNRAMARYDIQSTVRVAAFLAQISVESQGLTKFVESLYYTDAERAAKLFRTAFDTNKDKVISAAEIEAAKPYLRDTVKMANKVYANRMGNGNEASGDGAKYLGRGPIQLTGKDNYRTTGTALALDLVNHPELLAEPQNGLYAAGLYWFNNGLNTLADKGQFDLITKAINPAMVAAAERRAQWEKVKAVLNG